MKAVVLTGLRKLETVEVPNPKIEHDGDVLVRLMRVGVCGSDLHYYETGRIGAQVIEFPFILGHECAGVVSQVGAAVERVKPGDTVAIDPAMPCFECDQCRAGRENTCRRLRFLGCPDQAAGCLSEWLVMPESSLFPTTGRLTAEQSALCEPLSIAVYAVRRAMEGDGGMRSAAILGAGPIGLCVLRAWLAEPRHRGYVTDRLNYRVEAARSAGAQWAGNPEEEDIAAGLRACEPEGVDVVFECAGDEDALDQAVEIVKPGGRLMLLGIPRHERVSFRIDLLRRKEITITNVRRQNRCVEPAIDGQASGRLNVDFLTTHRFPLEETGAAFELVAAYQDHVLKAMIELD